MLVQYVLGTDAPPRRGNRLLFTALKSWDKCCKLTRTVPRYAAALPLVGFPIGLGRGTRFLTEVEMGPWAEVGVRTIGDCNLDHSLIPLDQLSETTGLPVGQFLKYNALTRSFRKLWGLPLEEPKQHEVLQVMLLMGTGRHLITW